ncbi:MAG TPA: glycosyltransferase family 4 protein [Lacipirellulaceae bacterium]|nr:glycosyltransferase family 4 protein [Lacipirellulaceae bacterium]
MKRGLEQFIYREIDGLASRGIAVRLFPTKHRPGLYNPPPEWDCQRWHWSAVLASQPLRLLSRPMAYIRALIIAIRYRALVDFLLAAYFVPSMSDVDAIYATFGDRKLFVGYFCKQFLNIPLAVEIHAYELYRNPNPAFFPVALGSCGRIIAATEHNRAVLQKTYGVAGSKIEVVRYSLDLCDYRPASKFVVLIVAFFVEKKGHEILLQAVKSMGRDDVEVWIVGGTGGSTSVVDVEAIVKQLEMESQVAFFGKLSGTALKAVYHACDVFCLPSRVDRHGDSEGFPNVIIEAMACGKPVVTTRHVEIPRIVEQILVDENDVHGLAEALEKVYQSPSLRRQLGERNRELAEEYFSTQNVGQTAEILVSMTEAPQRARPPVEERSEIVLNVREDTRSELERVV